VASDRVQKQYVIRRYKEETGKTEISMKEVVTHAIMNGWIVAPAPVDPLDRLARDFSDAARDEIRHDKKTGKPYRANHAISTKQGHLWVDIDEAPRKPMHQSLMMRREQMVGDGLQLSLDADHWNSIHPSDEPIDVPLDFTDDVLWRKNVPEKKTA
jgi:hypothetical protein